MRIILATTLLLMVTACERSKAPPRASTPPSTQSIPAEPASAPAIAVDATVAPPSKPLITAPRKSAATKAPRSVAKNTEARAYDKDPPPFDDELQSKDATSDFQSEQAQRDRELLERDAREAQAREQDGLGDRDDYAGRDGYEDEGLPEYDGMHAPEDFPPTDDGSYDEPPFEDEYPIESEFPPEDEYPLDDDY